MGRSKFSVVLNEVEDRQFLNGSHSLYLYDPSGMGKPHLLAALVCYLIQKGSESCISPIAKIFSYTLREALLFAFHGDPHSCETINFAKSAEILVECMKATQTVILLHRRSK